jgi:hypothetical protein
LIWIMTGQVGKVGHRARPERVVRSWNALDSERSGRYRFFLGFFFSFLIEVPFDIQPPWRLSDGYGEPREIGSECTPKRQDHVRRARACSSGESVVRKGGFEPPLGCPN